MARHMLHGATPKLRFRVPLNDPVPVLPEICRAPLMNCHEVTADALGALELWRCGAVTLGRYGDEKCSACVALS